MPGLSGGQSFGAYWAALALWPQQGFRGCGGHRSALARLGAGAAQCQGAGPGRHGPIPGLAAISGTNRFGNPQKNTARLGALPARRIDGGPAMVGRDAQIQSQCAGGGGEPRPAGAAAAIYAARKGIRVGLVAERFGGQTNDTMAIENYISVLETDGPKFAAALEVQVRQYEVDIMNLQRVEKIIPASVNGGMVELQLANGGRLSARSVILSTGARWRNVNVPGEQEYKNKGVAYCPHCDGPLFKGKHVAVIGGGNSGVEAAIDLAGVVSHVTLFEFTDALKADAVLVSKLKSLNNVTIHVNAQTTEITGDSKRVNGLRYKDRATQQDHLLALEGVFVQIGLVPNTEFLKGTVELSKFGEIVVDAKCHTNVPGVFAAGDVTTVPFKQIVIAAGEGAKAALSAFDYLIRMPVVEAVEEEAVV